MSIVYLQSLEIIMNYELHQIEVFSYFSENGFIYNIMVVLETRLKLINYRTNSC